MSERRVGKTAPKSWTYFADLYRRQVESRVDLAESSKAYLLQHLKAIEAMWPDAQTYKTSVTKPRPTLHDSDLTALNPQAVAACAAGYARSYSHAAHNNSVKGNAPRLASRRRLLPLCAAAPLRRSASLSITGAVGTVYSVEYVTDLGQTNSWRCLEFLQPPASLYLWADKSAPATGQRFCRAVVFAAPTNLAFIPPGTFRMGSLKNEVDGQPDEGPQTAVTIMAAQKKAILPGSERRLLQRRPC